MVSHFPHSEQHVYRHSMHPEQLIHSSNRLRAESGSSESSRGSGSTGSGKSRRRSHRPRGCRGGSSRRRNNGCEGKKKVQQHRPPTNFRGHETIRGNNFAYVNTYAPSRYDFSFIPHDTHYQLQEMYGGADSGYSEFFPSSTMNNGHQQANEHHGHVAGNSIGITGFPSLQASSSESSNEMIPGYEDYQILPPMPTNVFHDQRLIPTGPNPYALNTSKSGKGMFNLNRMGHDSVRATLAFEATSVQPLVVSAGVETHLHSPRILEPLKHICSNSRHNKFIGEMLTETQKDFAYVSVDKSMCPDQDNVYRSQRLEKQRQKVAGGSLFVTSPRSFLMGIKTSFHEPSATTSVPGLQST
jgi:hypothetical protein